MLARGTTGEDRLDPKLFDAESTDEDGMSPPDRMPSAQDREKRLLELAAMQNEMLAAINATTQVLAVGRKGLKGREAVIDCCAAHAVPVMVRMRAN